MKYTTSVENVYLLIFSIPELYQLSVKHFYSNLCFVNLYGKFLNNKLLLFILRYYIRSILAGDFMFIL